MLRVRVRRHGAAIMAVGAARRDALAAGARGGRRALSGERTRVDDAGRGHPRGARRARRRASTCHRRGIAALPEGLLDRPRWVLIGMGSSGFAARDAAAVLRSVGHDAIAEIASASGRHATGSRHARDRDLELRADGRDRGRGGPAPPPVGRDRAHRRSRHRRWRPRPTRCCRWSASGRRPSGIATLSSRSTVAALRLLAGRGRAVARRARDRVGGALARDAAR